jgi:hypothetical protein
MTDQHAPCKGKNCGTTSGKHSQECYAEHEAITTPHPIDLHQAPAMEKLARRLLWIAFCWNDHNFEGAHILARREAEACGIKSFEQANEWLAAPIAPAAGSEQSVPASPHADYDQGFSNGWDAGFAHQKSKDDFLHGICVALSCVVSMDCGVTWAEIVRTAGLEDLLQFAAFVEPEEWELAGFAKYAMAELRRGKPRTRRVAPAPPVDAASGEPIDAQIERLIEGSDGRWHDGEFRIDGQDLTKLLRAAAAPVASRAGSEPVVTNHQVALENIASSKPRYEAAAKSTGSPERMRCYHCGYAWQPDSKPYHALDCAYMDAVNALATPTPAAPTKVAEPLTDAQIIALTEDLDCDRNGWAIRWVRAIEAAHGIVQKTLEI